MKYAYLLASILLISGCANNKLADKRVEDKADSKVLAVEKDSKVKKAFDNKRLLLAFDFDRKYHGKFLNSNNNSYFLSISGKPELVKGHKGKGVYFNKSNQVLELRGKKDLPFEGFICEFYIKRESADSKGILLIGPSSKTFTRGFTVFIRKNNQIVIYYATKDGEAHKVLKSTKNFPGKQFVHVKIIYTKDKPFLKIIQDGKTVAGRNLAAPILFDNKGTRSFNIGVASISKELNLNAVLDNFRFYTLGSKKDAKKLTNKKGEVKGKPKKGYPLKDRKYLTLCDEKDFKLTGLDFEFIPYRDYGIPKEVTIYTSGLVNVDGKKYFPRQISTELGFTGKSYNRFLENEEKKVYLQIKNSADTKRTLKLKIQIDDWQNKKIFEKIDEVTVPAGKSEKICLDLETGTKGCFNLDIFIYENNKLIGEYNAAYAITVNNEELVRNNLTGAYGQLIHDGVWNKRLTQKITSSWVRYFEYGGSWCMIEFEPGKYNWDLVDKQIDYMTKKGWNILYTIHMVPPFHSSIPKDVWEDVKRTQGPGSRAKRAGRYGIKDLNAWKKFLRALVTHYKDKVKYWEIWNEPNSRGYFQGTAEDYFIILKAAYETIKSVDPEAKIVGGVLCSDWYSFGKKLFDLGGDQYMDVISFHYHLKKAPEKSPLLIRMEQMNKMLASGTKKLEIWDSESSYLIPLRDKKSRMIPVPENMKRLACREGLLRLGGGLPYNVGERRSAAYTVRQRIIQFANGFSKFFTFSSFGMPAKVYSLNLVAREALVKQIADKKFVCKIEMEHPYLWGYLFADKKGNNTAVFWSTSGKQNVTFDTGVDSVTISDFLGNEKSLKGPKIKLTLSDYPVYVSGCGDSICKDSDFIKIIPKSERPMAGKMFTVSLTNTKKSPLNINTEIRNSQNKRISSDESLTLNGGETKKIDYKISKNCPDGPGNIVVKVNSNSADSFQMLYPVRLVGIPLGIPSLKENTKNASGKKTVLKSLNLEKKQIRLETKEQVALGHYNLAFADTPHWEGPKDLSAKCALAWKGQNLYFQADVLDDSVVFPKNDKLYESDCLQLYLDLRNSLGKEEYENGVFHLMLAPKADGNVETMIVPDDNKVDNPKPEIKAFWMKTVNGYRLNACIRIPELYKLIPNRIIGFDVALDDADIGQNDGIRFSELVWRGDFKNYCNASFFSTIKLSE